MLLENMLDAIDLVLGFALGELSGRRAAVDDRTVWSELGNFGELLCIF
jgi:hypothetical protein